MRWWRLADWSRAKGIATYLRIAKSGSHSTQCEQQRAKPETWWLQDVARYAAAGSYASDPTLWYAVHIAGSILPRVGLTSFENLGPHWLGIRHGNWIQEYKYTIVLHGFHAT